MIKGDYCILKAPMKEKFRLGLGKQFEFYYLGSDYRIVHKDGRKRRLSISKALRVTRVKYQFPSVCK